MKKLILILMIVLLPVFGFADPYDVHLTDCEINHAGYDSNFNLKWYYACYDISLNSPSLTLIPVQTFVEYEDWDGTEGEYYIEPEFKKFLFDLLDEYFREKLGE
jgi:hypothetical protein